MPMYIVYGKGVGGGDANASVDKCPARRRPLGFIIPEAPPSTSLRQDRCNGSSPVISSWPAQAPPLCIHIYNIRLAASYNLDYRKALSFADDGASYQ